MTLFFFWMEKLVARLLFPVTLILIFLAAGFIVLLWKKNRRAGLILLAGGLALFLVASLSIVSRQFLIPLENRYPKLDVATLDPSADYVIFVAGNGFIPRRGFNDEFLVRLQEAGRIAHELEARGGRPTIAVALYDHDVPPAVKKAMVADYFDKFRLEHTGYAILEGARNSRQEIAAAAKEKGRLIVVSNAYHVPRLMLIAAKEKPDALPAPAGWKAYDEDLNPLEFIPSAEGLMFTEIAVYENLGMLKERL
jgi:uncharacterized SAM-binding protein YcdF (DUF218 family)